VLVETDPGFFCMYIETLQVIKVHLANFQPLDNSFYLGVWSVMEPGLGIIATSLATTRPLFRRITSWHRNRKLSTGSSNSSSGFAHKPSDISYSSNGYQSDTEKFVDIILRTTTVSRTQNTRSTTPMQLKQSGGLSHTSPNFGTQRPLSRVGSPTVLAKNSIQEEMPQHGQKPLVDMSRAELVQHIEKLQSEAREWRQWKQRLALRQGAQGGLPLGIFDSHGDFGSSSIAADSLSTYTASQNDEKSLEGNGS
jgi:hypothetical protein